MPNAVAIIFLAFLTSIAIYYWFKGRSSIDTAKDRKMGCFLSAGMVTGMLIGGYLSDKYIPMKSESSIGILVLCTLATTVIGGFLGVYIFLRTKKEQPNKGVQRDADLPPIK